MNFTKAASELARTAQVSIMACCSDEQQLAEAISIAFNRQREFEAQFCAQLLSVRAELTAACDELKVRQAQSAQLAEMGKNNATRMGGAVGTAIVSLQAGDSTPQRLEHICDGLRRTIEPDVNIVPSLEDQTGSLAGVAPFVRSLQAAQLEDTVQGFGTDIAVITGSLTALSEGSANIVDSGQVLFGSQSDDRHRS